MGHREEINFKGTERIAAMKVINKGIPTHHRCGGGIVLMADIDYAKGDGSLFSGEYSSKTMSLALVASHRPYRQTVLLQNCLIDLYRITYLLCLTKTYQKCLSLCKQFSSSNW